MSRADRHVVVVGAGLAGLAAAAAAHDGGADVTVLERHDAPGGASASSVGWIWRYRDMEAARLCAPHADPGLRRAVVERLDDDIAWLERQGVQLRARDTAKAITRGVRVDPREAIAVLVERIGEEALQPRTSVLGARPPLAGAGIELRVRRGRVGDLADEPDAWLHADAVVFAGGGYAADLDRVAREAQTPSSVSAEWVLRAPTGGDGSSMDAAMSLGALRVPATGESMCRIVPRVDAALDSRELGRMSELHLPDARLRASSDGAVLEREAHDWSGSQLVWRLARTSGAGRLEFARADLRRELAGGTVEQLLRTAISAGAETGRTGDGGVWLAVRAGITHTLCGLRVDADGRLQHLPAARGLLRRRAVPRPLDHAFAAGCDAAGSGMGGTASGLAQALVLGRRAGSLAAAG